MDGTTKKWPDNHRKHPIYKLLDSSADGKIVLQSYLTYEFLCKNVRNLLSRIVIKKEQDLFLNQVTVGGVLPQLKRFIIPRVKLTELALQICELFPSESPHTYYKPFEAVDKVKINPSGTLYEHYEYRKRKLRQAGLLASRQVTNQENNVPNIPIDCARDDLIWLAEHVGPKVTVMEKWDATYMSRQALLKQDKLSIFDYCNQLRCLTTNLGPKLFTYDFERLQPDAGDFCTRWAFIRDHLIRRLQLCKKIKSATDQGLLQVVSTLFPNNKDTVLLYLLPYLIDSASTRKRKSSEQSGTKVQAGSIEERRNSFILHVETAGDVLPAIDRLKEKLRLSQQTLQPLPILVGTLTGIEAAYVLVNDNLYTVNSSLEAIHLCFKIYIALDCAYPERASPLWMFIQKSLYNINFKGDVCSRSLIGLIGEVTHIITEKEGAEQREQSAKEETVCAQQEIDPLQGQEVEEETAETSQIFAIEAIC